MQTSNPFPGEPEKAKEGSEAEQRSQPFYEFHVPYSAWPEEKQETTKSEAEVSRSADMAAAIPPADTAAQQRPKEDLIRQGLVYPPPPSFYQQAQVVHKQPLPVAAVPPVAPPLGMAGVGSLPPQAVGSIPPGSYGPPFAPAPPMQPPVKKSYKWIWITVSILVVLLLAACGFCGWAFSQFFTPIVQSETNVMTVANNYYGALQNKDYVGAYQYLQPQGSIQGMTQATFTQHAQSADAQYGTVRSYTTGTVSPVTSSNSALSFSSFTVAINVVRIHQSYSVFLTLQKSGNDWKIVDFDRI
jgi:hypothetical protein